MAKLMKIDEITGNMFRTARNNRFIVHDDHIRRFAVQANVDVELECFKASKTWLNSFKKSHRIVSRQNDEYQIVSVLTCVLLVLQKTYEICNQRSRN